MKFAIIALLVFGLAFAGQIVNVGQAIGGTSDSVKGTPPADDSQCYNLHVQCLRNGCAAAAGTFNEETQGCDGGSTAEFASAVGQCSKAQGECIMGTGSGYSNLSGSGAAAAVPAETTAGSGAIVPISAKTGAGGTSQTQGGLCPLGFALALLLAAAYVSTEE